MSQTLIEELTPEQEAMMPVYEEKWWKIATSTASLDRSKAREAVQAAYALICKKEPEIIFADSPAYACKHIFMNLSPSRTEMTDIVKQLNLEMIIKLKVKIGSQMHHNLFRYFKEREAIIRTGISAIAEIIYNKIGIEIDQFYSMGTENFVSNGSLLDYCISELNCQPHQPIWEIYQLLMKNAGWIFPFEKTCIVCSRPSILSLDNQQRLHAEGGPAIQYADGLSVYACHGVILPEKYGQLHPHQWRSQWILEEENAELRRVLIQGIGYEKMLQELQAIALDSWQEYTLLRIDADVDVEPIYLLKMTCPSTGFIHALRVPPDVESAREAIRWVNWGIYPDEFQAQS